MNYSLFILKLSLVVILLISSLLCSSFAKVNRIHSSPISSIAESRSENKNGKLNSLLKNIENVSASNHFVSTMASTTTNAPKAGLPSALKLIIGAGGIYAAFLYYGNLQEDVFHYKSSDGTKFNQAWFLQALGKV